MAKIETKACFNYGIKPEIIRLLKTAEKEVWIVSMSFDDIDLLEVLLELSKDIKVNVLTQKKEIEGALNWEKLSDCGIVVYQLLEEIQGENLINYNFCLIDSNKVITGSYDWSNENNSNQWKDITIVQGDIFLNHHYKKEFKRIIVALYPHLYIPKQGTAIYLPNLKPDLPLETIQEREKWWFGLSDKLKEAFNFRYFHRRGSIDFPHDGGLQNLLYLETLNLRFSKLNCDLKGIEVMLNLKKVDIADNCISSLSNIQYLKNLETLICYNNYFTSLIGIEHLQNLTYLECSRKFIDPEYLPLEFERLRELGFRRSGTGRDFVILKR